MSVWYREAWDALLAAWDAVIAAAASAEKDASLLDDDGRAAVVAQCQRCAAAFGQLMEVVKSQEKRVPVGAGPEQPTGAMMRRGAAQRSGRC